MAMQDMYDLWVARSTVNPGQGNVNVATARV